MKKIYEFVGGAFNGQRMCEDDAFAMWCLYGNGRSKDWSEERKTCQFVPSELLDNEFQFDGYLSPMLDGKRVWEDGELKRTFETDSEPTHYVVRYETQEVYDRLSR